MNEHDFQAALPSGWTVSVQTYPSPLNLHPDRIVHEVTASHPIFGDVKVGPKLHLVPKDVNTLRALADDATAPKLTFSQWLAAGERFGFSSVSARDPMTRLLRLLAIYIDRGDIAHSTMMRVLVACESELDQLLLDASDAGTDTNELYSLLELTREQYMAADEVDDG